MKKKICMILIAVFVAVLGTSTFFIINHYKEANKQAELYGELANLVNATAQTDAATEPAEQIPYSEEKMLLPELAELYQQNGDLVGWISIADTNINYPVMQSVNEPNFYLKHGFDKDYSDYGCPYVQEDCDVQEPSDNLVIYGHHMSNGSMFAHLEKFKSKDFWSEHRMITFNTLTDKQEYEIVAVFRTVVYTDSPEAFKFYRFIDAESANAFDDFIAKSKELSFYDTGVTAEYGDMPAMQRKELEILNSSDQARLETALLADLDETSLGIYLTLQTGLRIGEVCALRWCDIDLARAIIHIRSTIARVRAANNEVCRKTKLIRDTPKTKASTRDIPIAENVMEALKVVKRKCRSEYVISPTAEFVSPRTFEYRFHMITSY